MPPASPDSTRLSFFGLSASQRRDAFAQMNRPAFRAKQLASWVYGRLVTQAERMTDLSRADRELIAARFTFDEGAISARQDSEDGTQKLLLTWAGGASAEAVMIPDGDRRTACVSSQVGCPVGCAFCASGIGGVKGNLSGAQIVEQIFQLNRVLAEGRPAGGSRRDSAPGDVPRISNVVFMGMGEPLANYAEVMQAIRILHEPDAFNLGARRITLSTVGVPRKMRELAEEELPINLAISLHAPNESLRRQLIPWAEHFALEEILDAARYYFARTGREITLEYILLSGVNDRAEHARQLAQVCKTLRANVNLIRYNEVEALPYRRPKSADVVTFQQVLRANGVNAHIRKSRGRDIDAACGQLRRKEKRQELIQLGD
jgi:23S rRNA (adenine2503-C2)-methyltransferase